VVVSRRGDGGGGYIDSVRDIIAHRSFDDALGGRDVVADVIGSVDSTDLRVTVHQVRAAGELVLPGAALGKICMDDAQIRVETAQRLGICRMFVDRDNLAEVPLFKARDKVLPDEARSPGNHDLSG